MRKITLVCECSSDTCRCNVNVLWSIAKKVIFTDNQFIISQKCRTPLKTTTRIIESTSEYYIIEMEESGDKQVTS